MTGTGNKLFFRLCLLTLLFVGRTWISAQCGATISYTPNANGNVTFSAAVTGSNISSTFAWTFGDGNSASGLVVSHTYTSNGVYNIDFLHMAPPSCSAVAIGTLAIMNVTPCTLNAGFNYSVGIGNTVVFNSTSTGTTPSTSYYWDFGDAGFGTGASTVHTYTSNITYTVMLTVSNGSTCVDMDVQPVTVTSHSCILAAGFTHTTGPGGLVDFSNTSFGITSNTSYYWDFGDGIMSYAAHPSHVYSNAGTHYVMLAASDASCKDTMRQAINITGVGCKAVSDFTLLPSNLPNQWDLVPSYPWNVIKGSWDWGDGNKTIGLYASHWYSVAGYYTICLTVTVSCDSVSTTCLDLSNYAGQPDKAVIYVNVTRPAMGTGIAKQIAGLSSLRIYPNPTEGSLFLDSDDMDLRHARFLIYNINGEVLFSQDSFSDTFPVRLDPGELPPGMYFLKVLTGNTSTTRKIIVNR